MRLKGNKTEPGGPKSHSGGSLVISVVKGLAISIGAAVVVSIILSIVIASTEWLRMGTSGLLLINYLSIAIGSVYGARVSGERGWLTGLAVGTLYGVLALLLGNSATTGGSALALQRGFGGMAGAMAIGAVAGMIGVNLKK